MTDQATYTTAHEIAFEAYGVRVSVGTTRQQELERMTALLPPGWQPCAPETVEHTFGLIAEEPGLYTLTRDGSPMHMGLEFDLALAVLDAELNAYVALHAPDRVFVHAGAVAYRDSAILLPGRSFAGKTTLVAALVRAGAVYYSDEYAVLDEDGLVHPYAKRLSLRGEQGQWQPDQAVESLGGTAGETPVPVGAVVVTLYRPGTTWQAKELSRGAGVLALLSNTVPAQERPEAAMRAVTRAMEGAVVLEGDRGEADEIVHQLLQRIQS